MQITKMIQVLAVAWEVYMAGVKMIPSPSTQPGRLFSICNTLEHSSYLLP